MEEDFIQFEFNRTKEAAQLGDADAQFNLGQFYECGEGVKMDFDEAMYWYRKAADQGHIGAKNIFPEEQEEELTEAEIEQNAYYANQRIQNTSFTKPGEDEFGAARKYQNGDGVVKSSLKAVKFLKQADKKNHLLAQYNLGLIYQYDPELKDDKEALKWYKKAAERGYDYAQNNLAWMYLYGAGVKKDSKEAVKWYKKAAKQNHVSAQYNLGNMHFKGEGVLKDFKEAVKWFQSSASSGFSEAELKLGDMYVNGEGVLKDYKEAAKWYLKVAEKGDFYAQYKLYIHAKEMSIDAKESIDWLHKSAGQDMFIDIFGLLQSENDEKFIIKSYKEAVCIGFAESQYLLGTIYFENRKTGEDMSKSKYWINKAYENSDSDVAKKAKEFWNKNELWINKDYKYKNTTEPSYEEKIRDIISTIESEPLDIVLRNNNNEDDFLIGNLLHHGFDLGILKDPIKAIKHYKKAAKKDLFKAHAFYELGQIYFEEKSIQNFSESKKWIKKAYDCSDNKINKKAEDFWDKKKLWNY